ncbi:uncharacterized protein LOC126846542 isoform X2 [Adelges cooleyi]|uniref:uncharacterized protein LOC126846542 isoform X2 n=1 Tax=Adelges cooleyi TaxID=133065 RepID=UPI00217FE1FB|nr:uncharacterized protein LOC126846542 isoform X2 [Adelges cooleyi]
MRSTSLLLYFYILNMNFQGSFLFLSTVVLAVLSATSGVNGQRDPAAPAASRLYDYVSPAQSYSTSTGQSSQGSAQAYSATATSSYSSSYQASTPGSGYESSGSTNQSQTPHYNDFFSSGSYLSSV